VNVVKSEGNAFNKTAGSTEYAVRSVKACVVFDSASGEIQHTHQVVTIEGAEETSDDEVTRRALSLARERLESGIPLPGEQAVRAVEGELEALQVDPSQLDVARPQRVDLATRSLVPTPEPARRKAEQVLRRAVERVDAVRRRRG
jgi:hypothetical protein